MKRYSIEYGVQIFLKGYGFLSFSKDTGKNLSQKSSQKLLDDARNLQQIELKLHQKE